MIFVPNLKLWLGLPLSRVVNVPMEEGKSTQQMLESLNHRIQTLGGTKSGTHEIDCDVYQSVVPMGERPDIYPKMLCLFWINIVLSINCKFCTALFRSYTETAAWTFDHAINTCKRITMCVGGLVVKCVYNSTWGGIWFIIDCLISGNLFQYKQYLRTCIWFSSTSHILDGIPNG